MKLPGLLFLHRLTSASFCATFVSFQANFFSPHGMAKHGHSLFWDYTSLQTKTPEKGAQVSFPLAPAEPLGIIVSGVKLIIEARGD